MVNPIAYECGICEKLTKEIFVVTVSADKHLFTIADQVNQPKIELAVCKECLPDIGKVFKDGIR